MLDTPTAADLRGQFIEDIVVPLFDEDYKVINDLPYVDRIYQIVCTYMGCSRQKRPTNQGLIFLDVMSVIINIQSIPGGDVEEHINKSYPSRWDGDIRKNLIFFWNLVNAQLLDNEMITLSSSSKFFGGTPQQGAHLFAQDLKAKLNDRIVAERTKLNDRDRIAAEQKERTKSSKFPKRRLPSLFNQASQRLMTAPVFWDTCDKASPERV